MVVHAAVVTSGSARAESWEIAARPESDDDALLPGHRVAAAGIAFLALITVTLPALLGIALIVDPGAFARAFS